MPTLAAAAHLALHPVRFGTAHANSIPGAAPESRREDGRPLWSTILEAEINSVAPPVPEVDGPYGGLSEATIWALIKRYQAGHINILTFLVVRLWLQLAKSNTAAPPALWQPTLEHWASVMSDPTGKLARDIGKSIDFFRKRPEKIVPSSAAESDEPWQTHVLLFILDHPQPAYRVAELHRALPARFQRVRPNGNRFVERREIQRFCQTHGIRRDARLAPLAHAANAD